MEKENIVLGSSNYTKEYLLDVLEVIGRPRGHVMHFRYRRDWVDPKLWKQIPRRSDANKSLLLGHPVLITFVYQKTTGIDYETEWRYVYPIRFGRMIDCFKTGDGKYDIAFFFFEPTDYCHIDKMPENDEKLLLAFNNEINEKLPVPPDRPKIHYSAAICQLKSVEVSADPDDSSFHNTAGRLKFEHFESPDGVIQYYPIFAQLHHFMDAQLEAFDPGLEKRYYEFTEGYNYDLKINTFYRKTPQSDISLNINCPEQQFVYPTSIAEPLESTYDEFVWRIVPAKVPKDTFTTIDIAISADPVAFQSSPDKKGEVLNLNLPVPILLKFNRQFRFAETMQDIGLALASILIALTGLLQKMIPDNPILNWLLIGAAVVFVLAIAFKIISQWAAK